MFVEKKVKASAAFLRQRGVSPAVVALSLESGMSGFTGELSDLKVLRTGDIPHFPEPLERNRRERILAGVLAGRAVLIHEGRGHLFEGYFHRELAYVVRVFAALGVRRMIFGASVFPLQGTEAKSRVADVEDHLDLTCGNPLRGGRAAKGVEEPDPALLHSGALRRRGRGLAARHGLAAVTGVLAVVQGPLMPTGAECRMMRALGADFFGFAPAAELAVARSLGVETAVVGFLSPPGAVPRPGPEARWGEAELAHVRDLLAESPA